MTKKHFIAIAHTIRVQLELCESTTDEAAIERTARALCDDFKAANPTFQRSRFLAACGVDDMQAGQTISTAGGLRRAAAQMGHAAPTFAAAKAGYAK